MTRGVPKSGFRKRQNPSTRCAICRHAERARIEALHTAGVSLDRIADRFDVQRDAVWRHMGRHVTEETKASYLIGPAKIAELAEIAAEESSSVLDYLSILRSILFGQLDKAAAKGDANAIANLSGRVTDVLREIGRVTGQVSTIASQTIINVTAHTQIVNSAPFAELQAGLVRVCAAHPEARGDIIRLFRELETKYAPAPARIIEGVPHV